MTTSTAALEPPVDALLGEALDELSAAELQDRIAAVTPLVARLTGWLQTAAGRLDALVAGTLPDPDGGRGRSVAGWLAEVQATTASGAGRQLRTAAALRRLPLVEQAVLDGTLTPEQAAVLTRLVGLIDADALTEAQTDLVAVAAELNPVELSQYVRHLIATHCEPALDAQDARGRDRRYLHTSRDAFGSLRGRFLLPAETAKRCSPCWSRWPAGQVWPIPARPGSAGPMRWSRCASRRCASASCPTPAGSGRS